MGPPVDDSFNRLLVRTSVSLLTLYMVRSLTTDLTTNLAWPAYSYRYGTIKSLLPNSLLSLAF